MKPLHFVFWIAAVLQLSVAYGDAGSLSSSELLESCQAIVRQERIDRPQVWIPNEGLKCWYYFSALQDIAILVDARTNLPFVPYCVPQKATLTQIIRVFVRFMAAHSEILHEQPGLLALRALSESWPCTASTGR